MFALWSLFSLPSAEELVKIVNDYFDKYGLAVVLISAIIEGTLIIGQYFPGSFVIFLGVITSRGDAIKATKVVAVVSIAFFIAYNINYLIGKYGWYKLFLKFGLKKPLENAEKRLNKHGLKTILLSYWEPNLASITATGAGVLKLPFKKFSIYSLIGILLWNAFWGILVFKVGEEALKLAGIKYITIIFLVWITVIIVTSYIEKKLEKKK